MFSRKTDAIWFAVGIFSIAGFIYVAAEHLLLARIRAKAGMINAQAQTVTYSNALIACRAELAKK